MSAIEFNIQKFDGVINFSRWQIKMNAILTRARWRKHYSGKRKSLKIRRKKLDRSSMKKPWQLFSFAWRIKCWMSFLQRKQHPRCESDFRIIIWRSHGESVDSEAASLSSPCTWRYTYLVSHRRVTSIINELDKLEVKIEDVDQTLLLLCSLPSSYKNFRQAIIYRGKSTIKVNEIKEHLLNKDKIDKQLTG